MLLYYERTLAGGGTAASHDPDLRSKRVEKNGGCTLVEVGASLGLYSAGREGQTIFAAFL